MCCYYYIILLHENGQTHWSFDLPGGIANEFVNGPPWEC